MTVIRYLDSGSARKVYLWHYASNGRTMSKAIEPKPFTPAALPELSQDRC